MDENEYNDQGFDDVMKRMNQDFNSSNDYGLKAVKRFKPFSRIGLRQRLQQRSQRLHNDNDLIKYY